MDQTGSGESKQPAEKRGEPSESSADRQRASSERAEQENSPENARRAFDLLERFSGELEEILQSLERAKGSAAPAEESPPAPERAYRPSSIHFDSSPISTRIDPYALPPVESPGATARPATRFLLEALFLIFVAAISARAGLRPLLIAAAEAVAFLVVASIELAIARESRHVQRFPAATPLYVTPEAHEAGRTSAVTSVTLDQVEPLVWRSDRREAAAEADWPLVAYELPSKAEETEEAQEGVTEISTAKQPEIDVSSAPKPAPEAEADLESAAPMPAVEPEPAAEVETEAAATAEVEPELEGPAEAAAEEREPARARRFHLFRHERNALESEMTPEALPESAPETAAEEGESEPRRHLFHPFGHEERPLEADVPEAAAEPEIEPEAEVEPEPSRHFFHPFRHEEKTLQVEVPEAAEAETETEAAVKPEIEPIAEAKSLEAIAGESEPEQPRRFHLFRHEAGEPTVEPKAGPESTLEVPVSEAEPERLDLSHLFERTEESALEPEVELEAEMEPEAEPEGASGSVAEEGDLAPPRHFFHPFRHEDKALEADLASEGAAEPEAEAESLEALADEGESERHDLFHLIEREERSSEPEVEAEPESIPEIIEAEAEPERPRRFHLFRHEEKVLDAETGPSAGAEPEDEVEAELETEAENPSEAVAEEREPAQRKRFHLLRQEADEPEIEPEAEVPGGQDESLERASAHGLFEEPGRVAETVETIEIDLPPEIAVDAIEHTLEDLGQRAPGLRRRRWPLGAGAEKDVTVPVVEDDTADGESELRYTAEQERRRREREYLRNLRVPR